jgi:integrase
MAYRRARITTELVEGLRPNETVLDRDLGGFMVRRQKGEARIYAVRKFANGKRHFATIGEHGRDGWTEVRARKKAVMIIASLHEGLDPAEKREKIKRMPTLAEWADDYLSRHAAAIKPKTLAGYRSVVKHQIAPRDDRGRCKPGSLGAKRLDEITRRDVATFHAKLTGKKRTANLAVGFIATLYSEAQLAEIVPDGRNHNPAYKIKKHPEKSRDRYLSTDEFRRLGDAMTAAEGRESPYPLAALRLLIFTGARCNEILSLRWSDIDFPRKQILLRDHKSRTTSRNKVKVIHLNDAALEILAGLAPIKGNPYVIAGEREGQHWIGLQKVWERIRKAANLESEVDADGKVEHVRIHDLRHSFAAIMTENDGVNLMLIGKLLGHSNPSTTQRYAHLLPDALKLHNDQAGARIAAALAGEGSGDKKAPLEKAAAERARDILADLASTLDRLPADLRRQVLAELSNKPANAGHV